MMLPKTRMGFGWVAAAWAAAAAGGCASPFDDSSFTEGGERGLIQRRVEQLQSSEGPRTPRGAAPEDQAGSEAAGATAPLPFEGRGRLEADPLVEAVLRRNPDITAMREAWRAVRARYPQVTSLEDPMLSYSVAPETLGDGGVDDGHKVRLSQNLPWPGKLGLRGEMVQQKAEAAEADVETVRQRLILRTLLAYYDYYYIHRALDINESNIALLKDLQEVAATKYAAGTASKQDALQAEVQRYQLEHRSIVLNRKRKVARARINTLLHRRPQAELPPPPAELEIREEQPDLDPLQRAAVNNRPELQALANRLQAQRAARQLADLQYFPDFSVMGTYNSLWGDQEKRFAVGAGINIPLQIDRRRGAELEALAEFNRLAAELTSRVDRVMFEVTEAHDRLIEAAHTVRLHTEKLLPAARSSLDAARSGYEAGDVDFEAVIDAEEKLRNIRLAHQRALADYRQRWADLERAVGHDLERVSDGPTLFEPNNEPDANADAPPADADEEPTP